MSLIPEQWAFLRDIAKLIQFAEEKGFTLTGGELWRPDVTAWLNIQPANSHVAVITPKGYTFHYESVVGGTSRTRFSKHCDRLAMDFNFFKAGVLISRKAAIQELGDFWESLNPKNRWGGNFVSFQDTPHFERNLDPEDFPHV